MCAAELWSREGPDALSPAVILACELLRVPSVVHGFSTRLGGVSSGELGPLDFGRGSSAEALHENRERLARRVGYPAKRLFCVKQVHGRGVVRVGGGQEPGELVGVEADALISDQPDVCLGVVTADCMPVLIASTARPAVAAAHAGWRGAAAGVLEATVKALSANYGCDPTELVAAVGPCVGGEVYEVSPEVAAHFSSIEGAVRPSKGEGKLVDLKRVAAARLGAAGVSKVALAPHCTLGEPELFHSFRRDGEAAGRQLNVIGLAR